MLFDKNAEPVTFEEVFYGSPYGYRMPTIFELEERFQVGLFEKFKHEFYLYVWTVTYDFDQFGVPFYYVFDLATGKSARDYADKRFRACYLRED